MVPLNNDYPSPIDFELRHSQTGGMAERHRSLALFILLVVGIGWAIGTANLPGAWYAGLQKPPFDPPNWVFAPTWTVLYVMIAVAGWRTYLQDDATSLPMQLSLVQMILNFVWSPVFFTLHHIAFALAIILTLFAVIVGFIWVQWRENCFLQRCLSPTQPGSPLHRCSIIQSIV